MPAMKRGRALCAVGLLGLCACSGGGAQPQTTPPPANPDPAQRHILFGGGTPPADRPRALK